MKKTIAAILCAVFAAFAALSASAETYTVVKGDSLWKISRRYEIGLSEIIDANPQIKDPSLIFPGDRVIIPARSSFTSYEDEVISLVNAERTNRGLQPLSKNWELCRVARYKSEDMIANGYFAHNSPTYGSPFDMMESFGLRFTAAAENIAYGQRSPSEVMNAWMNSAGHRSNILSGNVSEIGVGVAAKPNGVLYWTQMFIRPAG